MSSVSMKFGNIIVRNSAELDDVCRICLATDRQMYYLYWNNLKLVFENVTNLKVMREDKLPKMLCWECMHRLKLCDRFTNRARHSNWLLTKLLDAEQNPTLAKLKSIDLKKQNLMSNLAFKSYPSNHFDLHIVNDNLIEDTIEVHKQIDPIQEDIDVPVSIDIRKNAVGETNERTNIELTKTIDMPVFVSNEPNSNPRDCFNDVILPNCSESQSDKGYVKKNKKIKERNLSGTKIDRRKKPVTEVLNASVFNITHLSHDEQVREIENRKETDNYKYSEYKCTECFKGFLEEEVYRCHMIRHSDQCGTYVCGICKIHFGKRHALQNHAASHAQKFRCRRCDYVTTRRDAAKLHEGYHNGTRYQCPHCPDDFVKFSTYMSHVRIKHPSGCVCALCGFSFVSDKGLALHKKLKHRFDQPLITEDSPWCERCDLRFASEEALERHCKLSSGHEHSGQLRQMAGKGRRPDTVRSKESTTDKKKGKTRKPSCKPEGPITCEQCETVLPDSLSHYRHFRSAHPDKNRTNYPSMKTKCMCEVCGKMFQSLALLQDHSWSHTDSKQFQCPQCHKLFQRRYRLIAHRRLHAAPKARHPCSVCGKLFTTTSNMQRHMVSHTGLKAFMCEICGKCFRHTSEKRIHVTYVHMKKPWPRRSRAKSATDRQSTHDQTAKLMCASETEASQPLWNGGIKPKSVHEVNSA